MHYALFDLNHRRSNLQSVCPFHLELNDIRKKHTYIKHLSRDQSEGKVGKKGRSKPCRTFRKGEFPLISMLPFFTGLGSFSSSGHSSTSIGPLVLVRWMDKLWGKVQKKKLIKNIKCSRFWNVWKNFQIFNCNLSMLGEKWLQASKYYCKKKLHYVHNHRSWQCVSHREIRAIFAWLRSSEGKKEKRGQRLS